MKKKRLSFVCVFLCMSLLIMPIPASATNQVAAVDEVAAKSMAQASALEAFNKIYGLVIFDAAGTSEYHDYYGGCYINDENILVICVKNGGTELINTLNSALGDEYDVEYEFCDWSKGEVLSFAEAEINTFSSNATTQINCGYYSDEDNAYILEVTNASETSTISALERRDSNIPVIIREVETEQSIVQEASTLDSTQNTVPTSTYIPIYGGMGMYQILRYSDGTAFQIPSVAATIGICGYYNGITCILTAAHCCESDSSGVDKELYLDSRYNVLLEETSLAVHGIGDYAALILPSSYTPTNYIIGASGSARPIADYFTLSEIPQNTIIHKYGVSTQYTASKVSGNNLTSGDEPNKVSSLILSVPIDGSTSSIVAEGDSGGPVWMLNTSGELILVGIVQAKSDDGTEMYTTPIRFPINSGFIPYGLISASA